MLKLIIICRDTRPPGDRYHHTTYSKYYALHYASLPIARIWLFSLPNISWVIRASLNSRESNDFTASVDQKVLQVERGGGGVRGVGSQSVSQSC